MKNYMKYFLLMGLVSVAMALDEFLVTDSVPLRDDARPNQWFTNPPN